MKVAADQNTRSSHEGLEEIQKDQWKKEIAHKIGNYHMIGAYVALIFDPLFGLTDYFNIPHAWTEIFAIRLSIAVITGFSIYLFKKGRISTYLLVAIPFTLISLQNAYTYQYIGEEQILGHNLNYIALFLGTALFAYWPIRFSILGTGLSILVTFLVVSSNSNIDLKSFTVEGGLLLLTSAIFTVLMIEGKYRLKIRETKALIALENSLKTSEQQRLEIKDKNQMLLDKSEELSIAKEEIEAINKELSESNKHLEEKVEQRTKLLRETNEEMDQLVYSLSHDFRTPMVNAQGLVILAKSMESSDLIEDLLEKIATCLHRFDELLHDMTNYAVYWDKKLEQSEVSVNSVLHQVWQDLKHQHHSKVAFNFQGLGNEIVWQTHPEKLRVLLYCILSNAVRFQREKVAGAVCVSYESIGSDVHITVKDNGQGISSENLKRVFEMYYRGNKDSKGAGLGLYIARGIATQIRGDIHIESEVNAGTQVSLIFPVEAVHPKEQAAVAQSS